jgi:hypothetical protein
MVLQNGLGFTEVVKKMCSSDGYELGCDVQVNRGEKKEKGKSTTTVAKFY